MKKLAMLVLLAVPFLTACQQPQQQKALRVVVRTAISYGELQKQAEIINCGELPTCPKAEQIQKWLDIGNRFLTLLQQPIPPTDHEKVLLGLDIVIMEMKQAGAKPEDILYVQIIKDVATELFAE